MIIGPPFIMGEPTVPVGNAGFVNNVNADADVEVAAEMVFG